MSPRKKFWLGVGVVAIRLTVLAPFMIVMALGRAAETWGDRVGRLLPKMEN